ncbi:anthranilate phosphoribosyltransferase [Trueperella bialowiezensis]|uniref:Anthranilate phosphoribosyltransferase n=1 Tax=Trueperella bialowiezensis TaxID=312285 RepID=A0A3S4WF80_9ACTO|nr:anthranilate phosphoribosyltransferase [Trueperella bialowiezensis]VEI12532.1 Anthranilate phosphoribosyltransferase [Trueperella bialowiezensis]
MYTWPEITTKVINRVDLSSEETAWAMDRVMSGQTSSVSLAGFLTALATKGETTDELLGLADSMQAHAAPVNLDTDSLDIVGTGGDRLRTVNISTTASLIIAASGIKVVKHGNRASSSKSGSADCLEALGIRLDLPVHAVEKIFDELGITFLFANLFHPSMKYAATARRELGVGTAFNVLGPLTNPAKPEAGAIGVSNKHHAPLVAGVLARRNNRALVFRGTNGLDELSTVCMNEVWEVRDGEITYHELDATSDLGLEKADIEDLRGQDATYNAGVARRVLDGEKGPVRDSVNLNAAGAIVADGRLEGVRPDDGTFVERMRNGLAIAEATIDSGKASDLLTNWIELSKKF